MHLKQGGLNKEILGGLTLLLDKEANELCCVASPFKLIKATRSLRKAHADSVSSLHAGALVCEGCLREVYAKPMWTAKVATRRTSLLRKNNSNEQGPKLRMTMGVMGKSYRFR
jgi:hypothetical protein